MFTEPQAGCALAYRFTVIAFLENAFGVTIVQIVCSCCLRHGCKRIWQRGKPGDWTGARRTT